MAGATAALPVNEVMEHDSLHPSLCPTAFYKRSEPFATLDSPLLLVTSALTIILLLCTNFLAQTRNPHSSSLAKQQETTNLPTLSDVERELKGGEAHSYRINLASGQFLYALIEQKGIDVLVVLFGPDGQQLAQTDSPNDRWGTEPVLLVADRSGTYRVDVRSSSSKAPAALYQIRIIALHGATQTDTDHVVAQRAFEEAQKLLRQQTADAKRAAIEKDLQALPLFQAAGDTYRQALILQSIGKANEQLNEPRKALAYFAESLSQAQALGDRRLEASLETQIGGGYYVLGEPRKAVEHHDRALMLARQTRNHYQEASALNNIGMTYNDTGDWQEAVNHYLQALAAFQTLGNPRTEGITLNNIGEAYDALGEQQKAIDYLQQALLLLHGSGDKNAESYTLSNIGLAYRHSGDYQKALNCFNQARAIQTETGNRAQGAETLDLMGVTYAAMGQPEKALPFHQQAIQIHQSTGNQLREAIALSNLGTAYNLLGQPEKALENFNQALSIFRNIGAQNDEALALQGSARAQQSRGNLEEARKSIEESLTLIETVRARSGSQQLRASYLASKESAYEFYIDLLMKQHAKNPTQGFDAEALHASERARARSLTEMLNEAHADIRQGVDARLIEQEHNLGQTINAKAQRQIQLKAQKGNEQEIATLNKEVSELEDKYQQLQAAIRKSSPQYAALTQPQPLGLKEIQQQLDQDTVMLEYQLGDERSYVWVVTPNSLKTIELPKRDEIKKASRRVYDLLTARSLSKSLETAEQKQQRIAQADAHLSDATSDLSQMVLGPVASELGSKRLVIVADGALQYVPFGALTVPSGRAIHYRTESGSDRVKTPSARTAGQYRLAVAGGSVLITRGLGRPETHPPPRGGTDLLSHRDFLYSLGSDRGTDTKSGPPTTDYRPLIVDHVIISLPSASALAVQRRNLAGRKPAANAVAVIADPVFSTNDDRLKTNARAERRKQEQTDDIASTRIIEHLADGSGTLTIRRLQFTRQEADQILAVAPKTGNLKAIDFKANRATATSGELSKYRYVHFATHGYLDSERPDLSAVVLSLVDEQGKPQDGFLRAHEIYNLNLPAELVVLSACQTGLGKEIKGEGLVGLTRGFMYAGARRVLVSLWNVNDKATAELMQRFYRRMLKDNQSPASSLRAAQVEMWQQKQWQSPYYWAAFVLQGEWK